MCIRDRGRTEIYAIIPSTVNETNFFGEIIGGKAVEIDYTDLTSVSYTHLDVYKRQIQARAALLVQSCQLRIEQILLLPVSYTHLDVYKRQGPAPATTAGTALLITD